MPTKFKTRNRFLSFLLTFAVVISVLPISGILPATTVSAAVTGLSGNISGKITGQDVAGNITLTGNTTVKNGTLTVPSGVTATLDLADYTLSKADGLTGPVICVKGGTLTIKGNGTISGKATEASYSAGCIVISGQGTLILENGIISGGSNAKESSAGGVLVGYNSTFTMKGGTITDCSNEGSYGAGAVCVAYGGTFNMSGGTIKNSTTDQATESAGGVYVAAAASFHMSADAKIDYCRLNVAYPVYGSENGFFGAGGVYIAKNETLNQYGTFNMSGGNILNCLIVNEGSISVFKCPNVAAGVSNLGIFTISGGNISACTFYLSESKATDATVLESAVFNGGTMYADGGSVVGIHNYGGDIKVTANTSTNFYLNLGGAYYNLPFYSNLILLEKGNIYGGIFTGAIDNINYCTIHGGTFYGEINNGYVIDGGTFYAKVKNGYIISDGVFYGSVENKSTVKGGDFSKATALTNVCKISFDLGGADGKIPAVQWRYNWPADKPDDPTRSGYKFLGWYNGDDKFDFTQNIVSDEDITLTAKWQLITTATATAPTAKPDLVYNGEAQQLIAEGSTSDGTMMYKVDDGEWNTEIPTAVNAGQYTVYYYVKADDAHYDSDVGNFKVEIGQQTGSVEITSDLNKTYDGKAVENPQITSNSNGTCTVEWYEIIGTTSTKLSEAPKDAGTYMVRITVTGNNNFTETEKSVTFTISKATLTVKADDRTAVYGDVAPTYTVTIDGFKGSDNRSVLGGTLAFDCEYVQFSDKGNYIITPKGYESDNYTFNYDDGILEVSAKPITVTIQNKTSIYGNEIELLTADDGSGIVNGDKNVYSLSTVASKTAGVGKYDIKGTALDSNYDITFKNESNAYEITARELTVSVVVANKQYDGKNSASITSAVLNNVADNDAIKLVNGTPTFTSVNVGNGIAVEFTDFTLSGDAAVLKNYTLKQPKGVTADITNGWNPAKDTEYTVSAPNSNGWLKNDMVVTAKNGFDLSFTDTADGIWENTLIGSTEGENNTLGFYVRNKVTGAISEKVTVNYNLDKNTEDTATSGRVYFDERNAWESFLNTITFNLFFKDEVTVKVEAVDTLSGVDGIQYFVSAKAMTLNEVKAITDWTTMPSGGVGVTSEDAKTFVYFIRITDKARNVTYLSTDGAEFDLTAPTVSGVFGGKTYYTTQKVTVTDKNLDTVTLNGETVGNSFTVMGDKNATYTIVATDRADNTTTVTVTMKPISEITASIDGITTGNVTSDDKQTIEALMNDIEELLDGENINDTEKGELEKVKEAAEELREQIENAGNSSKTENTDKVKEVTSDTVTTDDKKDLENAKTDFEKTLEDYKDNLTEDEKKAVEEEIERIENALEVIEKVENVEEIINKLPVNITKADADAIKAAEEAYNALSEYEQSVLDKDTKNKLDDAKAALDKLNKADNSSTSPSTGDNSYMALWFALLFVSDGALIGTSVYGKKKKRSSK